MNDLPKLIVCLTTVSDEDQARFIAQRLLQERVAACVQVDSPIQSFYRWESKDYVETEFRLVIKSTKDRLQELKETLIKCHPYEQPQIVVLNCIDADPGYADWVQQCVH